MGKFDGILFCTDLDGTLLKADKTISRENSEAIEYFKSEGGLFTFVTGRVPLTSIDCYKMIKPNIAYGCVNGAGVYDGKAGKLLWIEELPKAALELVEIVDKEIPKMGIQINAKNTVYFNKYNDAMVNFRKITGLPDVRCHYSDVKEPFLKIIFVDDDMERMERLISILNSHPSADKFNFIRSEHDIYEILPKGITKATALLKLCEIYGVSVDKTIAIGDYDNDIAMVKQAKIGVAVENAQDELKKVADIITVSNEEHAICKIISDLDSGALKI